jgi:hypothetical protein
MTNSHRYIFTNARRRADFNLDNASDDLQTIARDFPTLFELLEKHCATYSGDVVAESVMVAEATSGAAPVLLAGDQGHVVCRTHSALWHCENERLPYGLIKRYLRAKFARDFAERAELIAAAGRATLLINDAIFGHGEEPLKLPKHVCDMLNSGKLTEQRSTAQLYKFLAGVRNALQRAVALPGGFRCVASVKHAASVAGVDPELLPKRILNSVGIDPIADAWCFETLTFRTRQLQRAVAAAGRPAPAAAAAAAPESDAAGDAAAPESDAAGGDVLYTARPGKRLSALDPCVEPRTFASSDEAAEYLYQLCRKTGLWDDLVTEREIDGCEFDLRKTVTEDWAGAPVHGFDYVFASSVDGCTRATVIARVVIEDPAKHTPAAIAAKREAAEAADADAAGAAGEQTALLVSDLKLGDSFRLTCRAIPYTGRDSVFVIRKIQDNGTVWCDELRADGQVLELDSRFVAAAEVRPVDEELPNELRPYLLDAAAPESDAAGEPQACNLDGSKLTGESVQAYLDQLQTAADAGAAARATQQLLQRAYDALDAVQASTGQTLAELIDPAEHADDATIDKVPNLLADLYDQLWAMERAED